MLFTQTLVEFHTVKTYPGAMQWSLTDYELVILALRTCTCLQAKIYQHVSFAVFHSLFYISFIALILHFFLITVKYISFLILIPCNGTEMAYYVLMCRKETAHSLTPRVQLC